MVCTRRPRPSPLSSSPFPIPFLPLLSRPTPRHGRIQVICLRPPLPTTGLSCAGATTSSRTSHRCRRHPYPLSLPALFPVYNPRFASGRGRRRPCPPHHRVVTMDPGGSLPFRCNIFVGGDGLPYGRRGRWVLNHAAVASSDAASRVGGMWWGSTRQATVGSPSSASAVCGGRRWLQGQCRGVEPSSPPSLLLWSALHTSPSFGLERPHPPSQLHPMPTTSSAATTPHLRWDCDSFSLTGVATPSPSSPSYTTSMGSRHRGSCGRAWGSGVAS
jgi:hypothetical protein